MKTLKTSILTVLAAIVIFCGINSPSYASVQQTNNAISIVHKPGPKQIWVTGHYKYNKYGKLVWVPGHWKRV